MQKEAELRAASQVFKQHTKSQKDFEVIQSLSFLCLQDQVCDGHMQQGGQKFCKAL